MRPVKKSDSKRSIGATVIPQSVAAEVRRVIARYPEKRSATLMVLHAVQDQAGWISPAALEWAARRLGLQPIQLYELVTFYPMFRRQPPARVRIKVCRTLSCALAGSHAVRRRLCEKLGLDPDVRGTQTTPDGRVSIEFVECLASCGTAPVLTCNDTYHEGVTVETAEQILADGLLALVEPRQATGPVVSTDRKVARKRTARSVNEK